MRCAAGRSGSTCQTAFWILAFTYTVALNCQNASLKMLATDAEMQENETGLNL